MLAKSKLTLRAFAKMRPLLVPLLLPLMAAAFLTACGSWLSEEFQIGQSAKQELLPKVASGRRLPDLPADIKTCLLKESCRQDAEAAKKAKKPEPICKTADDIVIAYMQSEKEKISCTMALGRWWKKQREIEDAASGMVKDGKHPKSVPGQTPKTAGWP